MRNPPLIPLFQRGGGSKFPFRKGGWGDFIINFIFAPTVTLVLSTF